MLTVGSLTAQAQAWQSVTTQNTCSVRHENAAALVGDSLYAIGGRGMKPLEALNLKTLVWRTLRTPPVEMNHFQAVSYGGEVYVMGAFEGKVCGIIDGHYDGHVAWFDEYDPKANSWKRLPDAPRTRDHISAAFVDDKLYLAGGRNSTARIGKVLETTIAEVDVYDFKAGKWTTLPAQSNLPTQRAGATAVTQGGKVWVIGGETVQLKAHSEAEILDPKTNRWTAGPTLQQGRHVTQAVVHEGKIYIVAGSANHGGGPELNTVEVLK